MTFRESHLLRQISEPGDAAGDKNFADERPEENAGWFELIANSLPLSIAYIDSRHILRYANSCNEELLGRPLAEALGQPLHDVVGDYLYGKMESYFLAALAGKSVEFEIPLGNEKDGKVINIHFAPAPRSVADGVIALIRDVTERRQVETALRSVRDDLAEHLERQAEQLRQSNDSLREKIEEKKKTEARLRDREAHLRGVMDNAADGIITADEDYTIISFNPAAEIIFGRRADEVIGKNFTELMTGEDKKSHDQYIQTYLESGEARILGIGPREVVGYRGDGSVFPLDLAISEMFVGDRRIFIAVVRDVTERRESRKALVSAKEQAELANRTKSEFLANISHELRTPLNAIIGFSDIVTSEYLGPIGIPQYKEYIQSINDSADLLLEIINDVIDTSKAEAGSLVLREQAFDVAKTSADCLAMMRERAKASGISLSLKTDDELPCLNADKRLAKQILINLLSNAIKFTPKGGKVSLLVGLNEDGEMELAVTDNGIGIAADDIPKALTPFGQVDSALNRKFKGAGLGLPLCKSFIELHGGRLEIDSELGKGTTASAVFPAFRVEAE